VNELFLDSSNVEITLKNLNISDSTAQQIRSFYNSRNYQYAWVAENGITEHGQYFWNLHNQYLRLTRDSSIYDNALHDTVEDWLNGAADMDQEDQKTANLELELTYHFFKYLRHTYTGTLNPEELQWYIPRKKVDVASLLDSLSRMNKEDLHSWQPVNKEYNRLKQSLKQLHEIQRSGTWTEIQPGNKKVYHEGDSAAVVGAVKKRLQLLGDLSAQTFSNTHDRTSLRALKRMQKRFGLKPDGIIGPRVLEALNVPIEQRIQQVLVNMERMRWLPDWSNESRIVVNIPEFKVHVYEKNEEVLNMSIVVGKAATRTVIFSGELKYIVLSPYWNVPASITRNEILPAMQRNSNYLRAHNMEITGYRNGIPVIRQKPGAANALGNVKFLFPNKYSIYLHDTPAKTLFEKEQRAFSHGCIRLSRPVDLAAYLLKNDPQWTDRTIKKEMHRETERWVTLENPVPVYIVYLTTWVDSSGKLNFRNDIYGHDQSMVEQLFEDKEEAY
jgi:murein L,D-transpeptidase YcbB/YkuD